MTTHALRLRAHPAAAFAAVVAGSLALWISARVQIPFWPVPMTMQTFVVVALGTLLGPRLGVATVVLYLAQGAAGLPVFAGTPERGLGVAYMAGPTGGFLAGFIIACALAGLARGRGLVATAGIMLAAHLAVFVPGIAWLAGFIGWEQAMAMGAMPFVAATVLKWALNVALARTVR
jgi:biotin transport system substrate-specific component